MQQTANAAMRAAPAQLSDPRPAPTAAVSRRGQIDALRILAVVWVLFDHFCLAAGSGPMGRMSVRLFLLISGYLITHILLRSRDAMERERTPLRKVLTNFYVRRALRIAPAYYLLIFLTWQWGAEDFQGTLPWFLSFQSSVLFAKTQSWGPPYQLAHLWTLSVQEQFYLLWPAILLIAGIRRGLGVAAAMVFIAPLLRIGLGLFPAFRPGIGETFPTVADSLATGCLLAGLGPRLARSARWRALIEGRAWWLALIAIAVFARNPFTKVAWLFGETILNVSIAVVIARVITRPNDRFGRLLNTAPLVWIGTLSYSLYLWQQPFLNRHAASVMQAFPLNLILAVAVAHASYFLVERPFLRLRQRIERRERRPASAPGAVAVAVAVADQGAGTAAGGEGTSRSATTGK